MAYKIVKIGDHYNDATRAEIIIAVTDDETSLPLDVPAGSIAYREDMSAQYLFGVSGSWVDVSSVDPATVEYEVTYNANGGAGGPEGSTSYNPGETVTVLFNANPTREGYTFLGWGTAAADTVPAYASGETTTFVMRRLDVVLYAVWEAVDYSVTYDANGGAGVPTDAADYNIGDAVAVLFTTVPTLEANTFLGWATTSDATEAAYTAEGTTSFEIGAANVTLYAVWQAA